MTRSAIELLTGWTAPDAEQEQLRVRYLEHARAHSDAWTRDCPVGHLTASALVTDATADRVLLVLHRKVGRWLQTGGHLEPADASLAAAALREATEESGLTDLHLDPGPLLLSEHPAPCRAGRLHLDVQFRAIGPERPPAVSAESAAVAWFDHAAVPAADATVLALVAAARTSELLRPREV